MQKIIQGKQSYSTLKNILSMEEMDRPLLVCGKTSYDMLPIKQYIDEIAPNIVRFSEFSSNPVYESVIEGVRRFRDNKCSSIIAVGGGSAIDVAKCIRHFINMDIGKSCLEQVYVKQREIKLLAIPTTAGTGSEATHFAVIYYNGEKKSVSHSDMVPDMAVLDSTLLKTLPIYQKKSAYLDALCQAIESWWSKRANEESIKYSKKAIELLISNRIDYLNGDAKAAEKILEGANLAGRAINITTTTAAHAMSYKLTSLYGIAHGHAVAICLPKVWTKIKSKNKNEKLKNILKEISVAMGGKNVEDGAQVFDEITDDMDMVSPQWNVSDIDILASSVNIQRLENNPVKFNHEDLFDLYKQILSGEGETRWAR